MHGHHDDAQVRGITIDNSLFWRLTGIVLVLDSAGIVRVPILHRMADIPSEHDPDALRVSACPFCAARFEGPLASQLTCPECEQTFRVLG